MKNPFTPNLLQRLPEPPRRVVLLRAGRIGDFVCATPAFRALRAALPEADITLITLPMLRELAERLPCFDQIVDFPGYPGLAEQFFDARKATHFFQQMQAAQFDLAVQMQGSGVYSNPFTLMLGARATAGCIREGDSPGCLDAALSFPSGHEIERVLGLATFLGALAQGRTPEFALRPEDHAAAAALLTDAEPPFIGLHASARDLTRRWQPERFVAVGQALQEQYGGTLLVLGEPGSTVAEAVTQQLGGRGRNLAGQTSLVTLGGVIAQLALLVTNDSGPAHIAYALGTPTVTILRVSRPAALWPARPWPLHRAGPSGPLLALR